MRLRGQIDDWTFGNQKNNISEVVFIFSQEFINTPNVYKIIFSFPINFIFVTLYEKMLFRSENVIS